MRLIRYRPSENADAALGAVLNGEVANLSAAGLPDTVEGLLALGPDAVKRAEALAEEVAERHTVADATLLAPLAAPQKIIALGLNFTSHLRESGLEEAPAEPTVFSKFASSITGPGHPVLLPEVAPDRVDYEVELAVVVGRAGRDISQAEALDWVAGYTVANDVSARDWQLRKPTGQWLLGKSFDTFLPLGPEFVTVDEAPAIEDMVLRCRVNGETLQEGSTDELLFTVPQTIAYVSRVFTLEPGDVLLMGTPGGVGMARSPRRYLRSGDTLQSEISGLGTLTNPVEPAAAS